MHIVGLRCIEPIWVWLLKGVDTLRRLTFEPLNPSEVQPQGSTPLS